MRGGAAVLLAGFVAALAACGGADQRARSGEVAGLPLVEELRIGSVSGGGADEFGNAMALQADAAGRIYVADGMSGEIRVFTPEGQHLRSLGGKGGGPGEFRMLSGMGWGPEERLWTMDPTASRLTAFDTAGALAGTVRREKTLSTTLPWNGGLDREGFVYDATTSLAAGDPARERPWLLVRFRSEDDRLVPVDTFVIPSFRADMHETRSEGLRMRSRVPYSPGQQWRLAPDGSVWIGNTGEYRLGRVSFDGDTLATLTHTRERVPVSAAERDSAAAADKLPADRIPGVKPAFRSFFVDDEERVWVEPTLEDEGTGWDVFSPAGAFLAHVRTPLALATEPPAPAPVVRDGRLYALLRDELDVPYVVRLRIPELRSAP